MMTTSNQISGKALLIAGIVWALVTAPSEAREHEETVLYRFAGGSDGAGPYAGLIAGRDGNFYGTTNEGGSGCASYGCGTVFKLTPEGQHTVLYEFRGGDDGEFPQGQLLADADGNLYGTTLGGPGYGQKGSNGTVFKLAPSGQQTVLHVFKAHYGGINPYAGLIADADGNLYGTTHDGGISNGNCPYPWSGCGVVFKLAADGTYQLLHRFTGGSDGAIPSGELTMDAAGNLYGTTTFGGGGRKCQASHIKGCGTVFKLTPDGRESVLHAFTGVGGTDGTNPSGQLIFDADGNLYGTTRWGADRSLCPIGCGIVFKLTPDGKETVLYAFAGGSDGKYPAAGLIMDANGNLYGTTNYGGGTNDICSSSCGTVFKVTPEGKERILYTFDAGEDGAHPQAPLIADAKGNLYGTTHSGGMYCNGYGCGTLFKVKY